MPRAPRRSPCLLEQLTKRLRHLPSNQVRLPSGWGPALLLPTTFSFPKGENVEEKKKKKRNITQDCNADEIRAKSIQANQRP